MSDPVRMTLTCDTCKNVFGAWRANCPTCGWKVPYDVRQKLLAPKEQEARAPRERRERERKKDECIMCRRRAKAGKKSTTSCPYCNEVIHARCLEYHRGDCLKFQMEVEALSKQRQAARR